MVAANCQRTSADACASACGIHPRIEFTTKSEKRKTDQGKKERFFTRHWRKIPMERKN
jgi:hypothetical protein